MLSPRRPGAPYLCTPAPTLLLLPSKSTGTLECLPLAIMVLTAFHGEFVHVFTNGRYSKCSRTSVDWLPLLIRIREVQASILGQQTRYHSRCLTRVFLGSLRQVLEEQTSAAFHILPNSLIAFHPITRRYVAWTTDCVVKAPAALLPGKELR